MNNWQEIFLFPVQDEQARKQFLIACFFALASFLVPIIPTLFLLGYGARIMRQVLEGSKTPSMPDWQESDWSAMLLDGLRLFGLQMLLLLPLLILMGGGLLLTVIGSIGLSDLRAEQMHSFAPAGYIFLFLGMGTFMLFGLLSFPYVILISAALPHAVAKDSFAAGLNIRESFPIFRKGLGSFVLGYALLMAMSFIFTFILQFAMLTIILICIVPLILIPYSAYLSLVTNAIFAQAYRTGREALQLESYASA